MQIRSFQYILNIGSGSIIIQIPSFVDAKTLDQFDASLIAIQPENKGK